MRALNINAPIGFTVEDHTYYYIKNIQGDVVCVADETGTPLANYVYDAWGSFTLSPASQTVSNQDLAYISAYNPVTYRGYLYDPELGFYYLQSRYYDPETGRFLNADDVIENGKSVIGTNRFSYLPLEAYRVAQDLQQLILKRIIRKHHLIFR